MPRNRKTSQPQPRAPEVRWKLLISLGLAAAVLVLFWRVAGYQFVDFDDDLYVTANPIVQAGITLAGIKWAFLTTGVLYWQPLTWLSHMLDCQFFGMNAGWHHLINVFLHAVNTIFLFLLLCRITGRNWRSAFVAALFAIHPMRVESVAWIAERKDVLSGFFWIAAIWAYVSYTRGPSRKRYFWLAGIAALGIMSKPIVVMLPLILLLLDYWPLARWRRDRIWPLLREKIPLFVFSGIGGALTILGAREMGSVASFAAIPLSYRVGNAVLSYGRYIEKLFWPSRLSIMYPLERPLPTGDVLASALFLTVVSLLAVREARRRPWFLVGWLWYLIVLLPTIGLTQNGMQSMADRFTYLPYIGLFLIFTWGAADALERWHIQPMPAAIAAVGVLAALGVCSWTQVGYWRDSITLFKRAVAIAPDSAVSQHNLAYALLERGQAAQSIPYFAAALRLQPGYFQAQYNMGRALAATGRPGEAIPHFRQALKLRPTPVYAAQIHNSLALVFVGQGKLPDAEEQFREAVSLRPDSPDTHKNLGICLAQQGKIQEAVAELQESLRLNPGDPQIQATLHALQTQSGRARGSR